jgi:two-component system phosphate regulon sensor histidine kinase PhoR
MIWLRTIVPIALWAILAWLADRILTPIAGWMIFSAGLACLLVAAAIRMQRVARWAEDPTTAPPVRVGRWDAILAPIYRHARHQARDLTQHRQALESMLSAAQALPDGVTSLTHDLQIEWCNKVAGEHLGIHPVSDRGRNILNLVRTPEFAAYAHQDDWPEPIMVRRAHGKQERLLTLQLAAYSGKQRLLISRDVTQLEKLETTRRDFVANVSHELRTPLTVLYGFLETFRDMPAKALTVEQRDKYMTMMLEQGLRMQAIVEDLLTLSTLESSPSADPRRIPTAPLFAAARQQAEALSAGKHTFVWEIDPLLDVLGAAAEFSSAVSNLLTNAVRYTPQEGTIWVSWIRTTNGGARYSVKDSGIGIANHHIPRLTERFYRVDRGRSRAIGGTGLGLAITKHIALRHDAQLEIESEPGQGSTFSLQFPPARILPGEAV